MKITNSLKLYPLNVMKKLFFNSHKIRGRVSRHDMHLVADMNVNANIVVDVGVNIKIIILCILLFYLFMYYENVLNRMIAMHFKNT